MSYYGATICLGGHVISSHDANLVKYCTECGKPTFSKCPACHAPIHGSMYVSGIVVIGGTDYTKPMYCYECGSPYPWTQEILDNAVLLLSLDEDLDELSKNLIKDAIPGLLVESSTSPIAIAQYKKGISHAGQFLKDSLYQLLVDVMSETVKNAICG